MVNAKVKDNIGKEVVLVAHSKEDLTLRDRLYIRTVFPSDNNWIVEGELLAEMKTDVVTITIKTRVGIFPAECLIPVGEDPDEIIETEKLLDEVPA